MGKILLAATAALLAGCVSVPPTDRLDDAQLTRLVHDVASQLDEFSYNFGLDGEPDFAGVESALANLRWQTMGQGWFGLDLTNLARNSGFVALGVAITACEDSLARLQMLYGADKASAMQQVRGRFRLSCVLPLQLLA